MACSLEEEVLHAFVLLALLPGSFRFGPAAKLLGLSAAPAQARGRLRALVRAGLLTATGPGGVIASEEARWEMHASVRDAACALADELGLGHAAARSVCTAPGFHCSAYKLSAWLVSNNGNKLVSTPGPGKNVQYILEKALTPHLTCGIHLLSHEFARTRI